MRFALSEDVVTLRDNFHDVLTSASPTSVVRESWSDEGRAVIARLWQVLGSLGVLGLLVPEDKGGFGGDEETMVAVMEEIGYFAAPGPLGDTVALVAPLLAASGDVELTPGVVTGASIVAVEAESGPTAYGGICEGLLLLRGGEVRVVAGDLHVVPVATIDGSRHAAVVTGESRRLDVEWATWELGVQRATLAAAAELVGLSQRMIDMTRDFVSEREQFGVPVGSFQAIKHFLANALISVEFARPAVWRAAVALRGGAPDAPVAVAMAKAMAGDAATSVAKTAIQCHGAMGYTMEYDLHLFVKRAWARSSDWGAIEWHVERVARALGL